MALFAISLVIVVLIGAGLTATVPAANVNDTTTTVFPDRPLANKPMPSLNEAYLYGSISILIVSLMSLVGALMIPCLKMNSRHRWMQVFVALAVATLSCDALMHLIPQALGIHHHDFDDEEDLATSEGSQQQINHDHTHEHDESQEKIRLLRLCVVFGAIYIFYLFESIAQGVAKSRVRAKARNKISASNSNTAPTPVSETPRSSSIIEPQLDQDPPLCWGFRPITFMILVGDAVHNFADGLAVGAAFAHSNTTGLATSIAIGAHEIPHEVGDFAILIESGLSIYKALVVNLLSSVTAFAGLYVGIAVGQGLEGRMCIFALAAGMFLYVAFKLIWSVGLPHLKHSDSEDPIFVQLALQNVGFIMGFFPMFLIAWFEDDIKV